MRDYLIYSLDLFLLELKLLFIYSDLDHCLPTYLLTPLLFLFLLLCCFSCSERMHLSSMYEHCVRMKLLSQRFYMLKVTQEEFLCMKALVLFSISEFARTVSWKILECQVSNWNMAAAERSHISEKRWEGYCLRELLLCSGFVVAVPVEGPRSQRCFDELRTSYIKELDRLASHYGETTRRQRLFQLTQLLDYLQSVTDTILPPTWNHDASINRTINVILDRTAEHRCGSNKVS